MHRGHGDMKGILRGLRRDQSAREQASGEFESEILKLTLLTAYTLRACGA